MSQAQQNMEQAEQELEKQNAEAASQRQQEALERLEQAAQDIEEQLEDLQAEAMEELRAELSSLLSDMLDRQKGLNASVSGLEALRLKRPFNRADRLRLTRVLEDQQLNTTAAAEALALLEDDASVVFAALLQTAQQEMSHTVLRLQKADTGSMTQRMMKDVELALLDLLNALDEAQAPEQQEADASEAQSDMPQGGSGSGEEGETPPEPLVPMLAEIKALKLSQDRVNVRTKLASQAGEASLRQEGSEAASEAQAMLAEILQELLTGESE